MESESLASTATKYDPVLQNNTVNDTFVVTILVGTGVAILIVLTAIVAMVTLVFYLLVKVFSTKTKVTQHARFKVPFWTIDESKNFLTRNFKT